MMKLSALPWVFLLAVFAVILLAATTPAVHALPEYAVQTGEPCATCHVSPSGGGLRTPRGLAWVAGGKQSAVPDLNRALEALGVHRQVDRQEFKTVSGAIVPPRAPELGAASPQQYYQRLAEYEGN